MTRKRPPARGALPSASAPPLRGIITLQQHWVESDAYDHATFEKLKLDSPSLQALQESGSKLLPHFDAFLLDLFALLFKMNIVVYADEDVVPSAGFYRLLLDQLRSTPVLEVLRQQTVLEEMRAGLATLLLGERLLELLKSERILSRNEMLDFWNLEQQENEIAEEQAHAETAGDLRAQAAPATQRRRRSARPRSRSTPTGSSPSSCAR